VGNLKANQQSIERIMNFFFLILLLSYRFLNPVECSEKKGKVNIGEYLENPFDSSKLYEFSICNKIYLRFPPENEMTILKKEQKIGYDAFESFDLNKNRFIYYVNHDYDMYQFGHHFVKQMINKNEYIVNDIVEI
jgi:hypothetical protein